MSERSPDVIPSGSGEAVWFLDDLLEIKLTGAQTGGALCLLEDHPAPGFRPLLHLHRNEDEIVYIIEGEMVLLTDEGETPLGPGGLASIPRGTFHAFQNRGDTAARRLVAFTPAGIERFFLEVGIPAGDRRSPPPERQDPRDLLEAAERYGWEIKRTERGGAGAT
jgi:mannose-6-phosphate isomerase-like protein (cupin superfamily)